jgi:hypothetical protein
VNRRAHKKWVSSPFIVDNPTEKQVRPDDETKPTPSRPAANKRWAELIYILRGRPLDLWSMRRADENLAFITDPALIRTILQHRHKIDAQAQGSSPVSSKELRIRNLHGSGGVLPIIHPRLRRVPAEFRRRT